MTTEEFDSKSINSDTPLVSVIMNCYNGEKYLREAIDSVYAQTYQNWEIIFWDNASTDSSGEIAQSYDKRLRYFRAKENTKLYEARNHALERCSGEFVAFLDCDDLWFPEKLALQIKKFGNPYVGLVYCNSVVWYGGENDGHVINSKMKCTGKCLKDLIGNYFLGVETVVVRKKVLLDNDIWFDGNFSHVGDAEFFIRVAAHCNFDIVDKVLAKWRVHDSNLSALRPELFYLEGLEMVENLQKGLIGFDVEDELGVLKRSYIFKKAFGMWVTGNGSQARDELSSYTPIDLKSLVLNVLSFVPFRFVCPLLKKIMRGKVNIYSGSC